MAVGRPTDYTPDVIAKAKEYIKNYRKLSEVVPTVVGLCRAINIARSTVYKWAGEAGKEEFSDIIEQLLENQELDLINGALKSELNPQIAKVMLGKHGYSDKQDIDHKSTDGSMSPAVTVSFNDSAPD